MLPGPFCMQYSLICVQARTAYVPSKQLHIADLLIKWVELLTYIPQFSHRIYTLMRILYATIFDARKKVKWLILY